MFAPPSRVVLAGATPALLALLALVPCAQSVVADPGIDATRGTWFRDASVQYGVLFKHQDYQGNYTIGSGSAWFDMDADGDEDLLVQNSTGPNVLYRNDQPEFVDVTATSGISYSEQQSFGVAIADFDADGLQDVYFTNFDRNTFFVNQGGGQFQEDAVALNMHSGHNWSTSASWADFDLDGDLDLYIGNYVIEHNFPYHYGAPNVLLENRGPAAPKWFENVAPALGVDDTGVFGPTVPGFPYTSPEGEATAGCTLATGTLDWDEDGDPDLQVGNDFGLFVLPNRLYRNDQSGGVMAFTDVNDITAFDTRPHYNMGIFPSDFDHDGDWDFYMTNIGDNLLLRNDGGVFVDGTYTAGPTSGSVARAFTIEKVSSWGCLFDDFDNDTWDDIAVVNGHIIAASFIVNAKRSPNHLWKNMGDGTFTRVDEPDSGMADKGAGRSISKVDLNSDGKLDFYLQNNGSLFVSKSYDRSRLFMNTLPESQVGNYLELDLVARIGHPDALGTRLDLTLGATVLKRQCLGDTPFLATNTRMIHFGLGAAAKADVLTIHWPSGILQTLRDVPGGQRMKLLEPAATGEGIHPLSYAPGALTLATDVRNHDTLSQFVTVQFEVTDTTDGSLLGAVSVDAPVAPGTTAAVSVDVPIMPGAYATLQGTPVEVRATISASGSIDQDVSAQVLP